MEWQGVVGAGVILGTVLLGILFMVLNHDTDNQCRVDALNAMCRTYGNSTGWAEKAYGSNKGFWVECKDDPIIEAGMSVYKGVEVTS